jgi:hypothetical protein
VYDPGTNTWTQKQEMPAAGSAGVTGVIGGKLYVVTLNRYADWYAPPNFFRYNPATNSWSKLPSPTNYAMSVVGGGVINQKLYLQGHDRETIHRVLEYDPVTNHWTTKRSWSSESCLQGFSCYLLGPTTVMLSRLYVFGEEVAYGSSPGIFIYDPVSDTWERKPLLTKLGYWADYMLTAARVFLNGNPRVEVIGGYRPGNNLQYIP